MHAKVKGKWGQGLICCFYSWKLIGFFWLCQVASLYNDAFILASNLDVSLILRLTVWNLKSPIYSFFFLDHLLEENLFQMYLFPFFRGEFIFIYWAGETDDHNIKALRFRQMKNFHLALMISQVQYVRVSRWWHLIPYPVENRHTKNALETFFSWINGFQFTCDFMCPAFLLGFYASFISSVIFCKVFLSFYFHFCLFPNE
jgi:hypothetical protein